MRLSIAVALTVLAFGCSRPDVPSDAASDASSDSPSDAASDAASDAPAAVTDADRAAILTTLGLSAGPQGRVENACGEPVVPQFLPAALGGRVGTAILFAMSGGPNMASCYGDGPDLHLMMRDGAGWREIYAARGRMLIVLPTATAGVRDLGDGGPGFSFPVWTWDGTRYVPAGRDVTDAELSRLTPTYLP